MLTSNTHLPAKFQARCLAHAWPAGSRIVAPGEPDAAFSTHWWTK